MSVESEVHIPKTKQQYSRNVKILKIQLQKLEQDLKSIQGKMANAHSIDNDRLLAMRFAKQCRVRRFVPEMIFRFADSQYSGEIDESSFRSTLKSLGFNLSQDQIRKITLLIDQDMSGKLTFSQYTQYLQAFNINTQTAKSSAPRGIKGAGIKDVSQILGKDRMIDWEQFYKFMKDKFPLLKQKDLIKIFNRLDPQNTGKISLAQLKKLINQMLNQQENMVKPKKEKQKKPLQKKQSKQDKLQDTSSIQSKIHFLLKYRANHSKVFHITQFKKVGHKLGNVKRFVDLFRDIDSAKIGSFTFNELIRYYLNHKSQKQPYNLVYEIIQYKLKTQNLTVQEFLFNKGLRDNSQLPYNQFVTIMKQEFEIQEHHAKKMYEQMQKQLPDSDKRVTSYNFINKFRSSKDKEPQRPDPNNLIELNYFGTKQNHFFKKGVGSIVFSPFLALKFCLYLQSNILSNKKTHWMDPQFGVTFNDRSGYMSVTGREMLDVDLGIDEDDLTWHTVNNLGMKQFYDNYKKEYQVGKIHNLQFVSGLTLLPQYYSTILWKQEIPSNAIQKLTQKQLSSVFSGIYPRAFHYFAKYGIYVFRYFIENRFVYVLVDSYIPTMTSKQIIFSHAENSWISLIQKGYAKVEGSYSNMLNRQSIYEVIYQLSHLCPMDKKVPSQFGKNKEKDAFWKQLIHIFSTNKDILISAFNDKTKGKLSCLGAETELIGEQSIQIIHAMQLQDSASMNSHKSHRLLIMKLNNNKKFDDKLWNSSWSKFNINNKYDNYLQKIQKDLKEKGFIKILAELKMNNVIVLNFKRFRSMYDRIYYLQDLQSQKWNSRMALDRMLVESGKYVSQFRVQSRMKTQVVLSFLKRVQKPSTVTIMVGQKNKKPIITKVTTQDFLFVKIPEIQANIEYVVSVYCKEQIIDFFLAFHLETKDYKAWKSNGPAKFHDIRKLQQICAAEYEDTDPKVKQYLQRKLFNVEVKKKKFGCCG